MHPVNVLAYSLLFEKSWTDVLAYSLLLEKTWTDVLAYSLLSEKKVCTCRCRTERETGAVRCTSVVAAIRTMPAQCRYVQNQMTRFDLRVQNVEISIFGVCIQK